MWARRSGGRAHLAMVHSCNHGMVKMRGPNQLARGAIWALQRQASTIVSLCTALLGRTSITADDSAKRMNNAARAIATMHDNHTGNDGESDNDNPQVDVDTWSAHPECARCNRGEQSLCRTAELHAGDSPHRTAASRPQPKQHVGATAASRTSVNGVRIMATLYADNIPARWMVASATWWPQPRTTQERHANCERLSQRCRHYGRHEASLFARQPIEEGDELTVPRSLAPRAGAALVPYIFSMGAPTHETAPQLQAQVHYYMAHPQPRPTHVHCQGYLGHPRTRLSTTGRGTRMWPCAASPDLPGKGTLGFARQHIEGSTYRRLHSRY